MLVAVRREFYIVVGKVGHLACFTTLCVVGKEVHYTVAIRQVVDLTAYPHGNNILSR